MINNKKYHCWYCAPHSEDKSDQETDIIGILKDEIDDENPGPFASPEEWNKFRNKKIEKVGKEPHEVVTPQQIFNNLQKYSKIVFGTSIYNPFLGSRDERVIKLSDYSGYYDSSGDWVEGTYRYSELEIKGKPNKTLEVSTCKIDNWSTERIYLYEYDSGLLAIETSALGIRNYGHQTNSYFVKGWKIEHFLFNFFKGKGIDVNAGKYAENTLRDDMKEEKEVKEVKEENKGYKYSIWGKTEPVLDQLYAIFIKVISFFMFLFSLALLIAAIFISPEKDFTWTMKIVMILFGLLGIVGFLSMMGISFGKVTDKIKSWLENRNIDLYINITFRTLILFLIPTFFLIFIINLITDSIFDKTLPLVSKIVITISSIVLAVIFFTNEKIRKYLIGIYYGIINHITILKIGNGLNRIIEIIGERRKQKESEAIIFSPADLEDEDGHFPEYMISHEVERHKSEDYYGHSYKTEKDTDLTKGERRYFEEITDLDQWAAYRGWNIFKEFREEITGLWISPNIEVTSYGAAFFCDFLFGSILNHLDLAIEKWEKALQKTGKGRFNKNLGIAYLLKTEREKENKLQCFEKALQNFKEYKEKGIMDWQEEEPLDAIIGKLENKIIRIMKGESEVQEIETKKSARSYLDEGRAYHQKRLYNEAVECYTKAIKQGSTLTDAYTERGWAYCGIEKYNSAVDDFNKALKLSKEEIGGFGTFYTNESGKTESIMLTTKTHILIGLTYAYYKLGEINMAKETCKKIIGLDKEFPKTVDKMIKEKYGYQEFLLQIIKELLKEIGY